MASAMWDSQQMPSLVITYSLDPHFGCAREPPIMTAGLSDGEWLLVAVRLRVALGMT